MPNSKVSGSDKLILEIEVPDFVSIPGEKSMNSDFEVHSRVGRIVGARIASEVSPE